MREATTVRSLCTTTKSSPRSPQLEKARAQQRRPSTAPQNLINELILEKRKWYLERPSHCYLKLKTETRNSLIWLHHVTDFQTSWLACFLLSPWLTRRGLTCFNAFQLSQLFVILGMLLVVRSKPSPPIRLLSVTLRFILAPTMTQKPVKPHEMRNQSSKWTKCWVYSEHPSYKIRN